MTSNTKRGIGFQVAGVLAVAALSAGAWFAWMGWDHQYQIVDGEPTGPYEAWQVAGCVLTLLAVFVGALLLRVRAWAAAAALVLAFTIAWTAQASGEDESGMYAVGALFLLVGLIAGTTLVSAVVLPLRASWQAKH
jgi:hypothetical protein